MLKSVVGVLPMTPRKQANKTPCSLAKHNSSKPRQTNVCAMTQNVEISRKIWLPIGHLESDIISNIAIGFSITQSHLSHNGLGQL